MADWVAEWEMTLTKKREQHAFEVVRFASIFSLSFYLNIFLSFYDMNGNVSSLQ